MTSMDKPDTPRADVFSDISAERVRQDDQWGGPVHDDSHERHEWCEYIRKQNNHAVSSAHNPAEFEARMVKVAALAVAAIESSRRQRPPADPPAAQSADAPVVLHKKRACLSCHCSQTLPADLQECRCSCHPADRRLGVDHPYIPECRCNLETCGECSSRKLIEQAFAAKQPDPPPVSALIEQYGLTVTPRWNTAGTCWGVARCNWSQSGETTAVGMTNHGQWTEAPTIAEAVVLWLEHHQ